MNIMPKHCVANMKFASSLYNDSFQKVEIELFRPALVISKISSLWGCGRCSCAQAERSITRTLRVSSFGGRASSIRSGAGIQSTRKSVRVSASLHSAKPICMARVEGVGVHSL